MLQCSMKCKRIGAPHRSNRPDGIRFGAYTDGMTEAFSPDLLPSEKEERYRQLLVEIQSVLQGETNRVARMATVTSMLSAAFSTFFWTGFYQVDPDGPDELVIGPYQGSLGCLRIAFGRGVCGDVAQKRETCVVPDVDAFPGHIACDSRSRSEIVVPVLDAGGELLGVLDVDSTERAAFDAIDQAGLEAIVRMAFAH